MTLDDPAGLVERFHQALVEEIRSNAPRYLHEPFTVAEIYQELVPYHSHRNAIGVEMNADYEDALLRLLSGQGGYVELESEAAVRKIRNELDAQNPDTGLYREFAAAEVRLNPEKLREDGDRDQVLRDPEAEPGPEPAQEARPRPRASARKGGDCRLCGSPLPDRDDVVFCPACGADQRKVSCPSCGTELEGEWRFCVACGEEI